MSAISLRPVRFNEIYELRKMTINNHFDNEFTSQFVFQDCHLIDSSRVGFYKFQANFFKIRCNIFNVQLNKSFDNYVFNYNLT